MANTGGDVVVATIGEDAAGGVHMRDDGKRAGEGEPAKIVGDPRRAEGARGGALHNALVSRANPQWLYPHQLVEWHRNVV